MNPYTAQSTNIQQSSDANMSSASPAQIPSNPSPIKKFLPLIATFIVLLLIIISLLVVKSKNTTKQNITVSPTPRPTATPFPPPAIPLATAEPTTSSATVSPAKVGRLAFIKDGDIYHSDLATITLLVKNATAAGDRLSWSPLGNFLSWRPKSVTATPSALVIYNRVTNLFKTFQTTPGTELMDYSWSFDEKQIAVLTHDSEYKISLFSTSFEQNNVETIETRPTAIKQIIWLKEDTLLFSTDEGIFQMKISSSSSSLFIRSKNIIWIKVSPDKSKILYSSGTNEKNDLSIAKSDGTQNQILQTVPARIDMGTTDIAPGVLQNGFLPFAVWFPKGDKLMVGYHYLPQLPLVGIYNLSESTFSAITPFTLYASDIMIDEMRLMGARVKTVGGQSMWQLSLFTIEDGAKLASIRVIPEASSPTFFDLYAVNN